LKNAPINEFRQSFSVISGVAIVSALYNYMLEICLSRPARQEKQDLVKKKKAPKNQIN
jgi:hypothetical protein